MLRSEIDKHFKKKGYQYSGMRKQGRPGFVSRWESYTSGNDIILIKGTDNITDGAATFIFKEFEDNT